VQWPGYWDRASRSRESRRCNDAFLRCAWGRCRSLEWVCRPGPRHRNYPTNPQCVCRCQLHDGKYGITVGRPGQISQRSGAWPARRSWATGPGRRGGADPEM
jgi:hypothetical protein